MKNSQKGFAPIFILIAIAAAVLFGGGGYYYVKKVKTNSPARESSAPSVSKRETPPATSDLDRCQAQCREQYGGSGSAGFDACMRACGQGVSAAAREVATGKAMGREASAPSASGSSGEGMTANQPTIGSSGQDSFAINEPGLKTSTHHTIEITANGFSPANLEIMKGDMVEFINKDEGAVHWPASGMHPTHLLCKGFDSLRGLSFNETYSFTFTETKECPMHDHLKPSLWGKIIVK